MELKITSKKEAPLLHRTEITALITGTAVTPSKEEVKKKCASAVKAPENLIIVKNIKTSIGSTSAIALVYQYANEEKLKSIEPKSKEEAKPAEEKKEEAKPAEAK